MSEGRGGYSSRILRNMVVLVAGQAVALPVTLATSIVMIRYLGAEGFGDYSAIYAYLGLFTWIGTFGMENILVREGSQRTQELGKIWGTGIVISSVTTLAAVAISAITAAGVGYTSKYGLLLVLGGVEIILMIPPRLFTIAFQVELEQWKATLTNFLRQLAWLGAVYLLSRTGADLTTFISARTGIAVLETAAIVLVALPLFKKAKLGFDRGQVSRLVRGALPLALSYLAISVYHRIDRVMIERFVGPTELGYYAAADNIVTLIAIIPLAFMMSVYPVLCRRVDDNERFAEIGKISFRLVIAGVVGCLGIFLVAGTPMITFVYKPDFAPAGPMLKVLLFAQVAVAFGIVLSQILISVNLQRFLTVSTVAGAVFNVVANLLVLPRWGAIGAAWATVGSYWVAGVFFFELFRSTRRHSHSGLVLLAKILAAGSIAFLPSYIFFRDSYLAASFSAVVYIGIMVAFGLLGRSDFELLLRSVRTRGAPQETMPEEGPEGDAGSVEISPEALASQEEIAETAIRQVQTE